jgi:hypothetical protein
VVEEFLRNSPRGTTQMPCCEPRPPEYFAWRSMLARCLNANHPKWPRYGGRGIGICDRWRNSFALFLADMGPRPGRGHSLDRRENDGNYEPGNCRWATRPQQDRNRGDNRIVEYGGLRLPAVAMCERFGVNYVRFRDRLRHGWTVARAIEEPVNRATAPGQYEYRGRRVSLPDLAKLAGVTPAAIHHRLKRGLTVEQAVALPRYSHGRPRKAVP